MSARLRLTLNSIRNTTAWGLAWPAGGPMIMVAAALLTHLTPS